MITIEQFTELAHRTASRYSHRSEPARAFYTFSPEALADLYRQVCAAIEADRAQKVPDGWALVPIEPDDALMRPFYACPPDELSLAWRAMHMVAARKSRLLASTPAPAQQESMK